MFSTDVHSAELFCHYKTLDRSRKFKNFKTKRLQYIKNESLHTVLQLLMSIKFPYPEYIDPKIPNN